MSRSLIRTLSCGFLIAIALVIQSTNLFAQSEDNRNSPEAIATATLDYQSSTLEMLKLNNELRNGNDLSSALSNAKDTLKHARNSGDKQLIFVAQTHVDSIDCLMKGISNKIRVAPEELKDASPELRLLYYSALLETKICFFDYYADYKTLLYENELASSESNDPYLTHQQESLDIYVRVFRLFNDPNSADVQKQCKIIRAKMLDENHYPGAMAIYHLVQSKTFRVSNGVQQKKESLESALKCAKDAKNSMAIIRCYVHKAALAHKMKKSVGWEKSTSHFNAAISESEAFNAPALTVLIRTGFAVASLNSDDPKTAAHQYEKVRESVAYDWMTPKSRHLIDEIGACSYVQLQDEKKLQALKGHRLSPEKLKVAEAFEKALITDNNHFISFNQRTRDKDAEIFRKDAQNVQLEQDNLIAYDSILFFKTLSLFLAISVMFLAPWFISYVLRSRLKRVSTELDSQRESSRQSQERCDELSLRLNRLQRMESLGLMAGSVAHDFNNILVGVMGNAEVIQLKNAKDPNKSTNDEFVNERIGSIIRSAEKAASLSRQMLAYAGKQHIARKPTDLNQLICDYDSILRSACGPKQHLKLELNSKPIVCRVDPTQIEQVVLNLVTNAVEASDDHGTIRIRTGSQRITNVENDCSLYGTRTTGGDFNFIDVIDLGAGISEADLERIFEPFFSNSEIGRGLGLSVVYGAVIGHDGFIKCCSNIGQGTSFRILIPMSTESIAKDSANDLSSDSDYLNLNSSSSAPHKILVVDDEETVLDLCEQLLHLNGWEVIKATGGEHGVRLAELHANELSCILADVVMPEMGANELLRELEIRRIDVPVVLMSGFSQTRLEFFLERDNVVSIIQKPFRASEITRAILNAIETGMPSRLLATGRHS